MPVEIHPNVIDFNPAPPLNIVVGQAVNQTVICDGNNQQYLLTSAVFQGDSHGLSIELDAYNFKITGTATSAGSVSIVVKNSNNAYGLF